ncbi:MAG: hypothetical protein ACYC2Y_00795 [Armatimonadota bacterium]
MSKTGKKACESCGGPARYAVRHGHTELLLCTGCSGDYERVLYGNTGVPLAELAEAVAQGNRTKVCPNCGNDIHDVTETGAVGCATCYLVFRREVDGVITKLHKG